MGHRVQTSHRIIRNESGSPPALLRCNADVHRGHRSSFHVYTVLQRSEGNRSHAQMSNASLLHPSVLLSLLCCSCFFASSSFASAACCPLCLNWSAEPVACFTADEADDAAAFIFSLCLFETWGGGLFVKSWERGQFCPQQTDARLPPRRRQCGARTRPGDRTW